MLMFAILAKLAPSDRHSLVMLFWISLGWILCCSLSVGFCSLFLLPAAGPVTVKTFHAQSLRLMVYVSRGKFDILIETSLS